MYVLIAGVGYTNLQDLSLGSFMVPQIRQLEWPPGVDVDDLSFGPIAVVHRFQDRPGYYDRVVLVSAVERGREPGGLYSYQWDGSLPDADEIQQRIGEAVTGVISLDNLLVIGGFFEIWPGEVVVVEVEPRDTDWGLELSEPVRAAIPGLVEVIRRVALEPLDGLPSGSLIGKQHQDVVGAQL